MSQRPVYSFLGPTGTFTEAALKQVPAARDADWRPVSNVAQAIDDILGGVAAAAMVPIENSIEGGVSATQDALARAQGVRIIGEYVVPITFHLYVRPGTTLEAVKTVTTHPVAYAQCRNWLNRTLPDHLYLPSSSTAAAAAGLLEHTDADAALAAPTIAEYYPLETLREGIGDNPNAVTRFILITSSRQLPEPTGADKTSLIVELPSDDAGALLRMLEQFSTRNINLSRIESRPIGDELGRYRFNIDAEGHIRDARLSEALMGLKRTSPNLIFLGSYPRADHAHPSVAEAHSNDAFAGARAWLDDLLDG